MKKLNYPVILLKGIILIPNNDLRLEFENNQSKNILDAAEFFHDNKLLVVNQIDSLEETSIITDLPKIGVVARISHKMELPNGNVRVTLSGLSRAYVHEYLNINKSFDSLESIVSEVSETVPDSTEEPIILNKLLHEFEKHIKLVPYITNSILSSLNDVKTLSKMTDIIAPQVAPTNERLNEYLMEFDVNKRTEMILKDIYEQQEMFKIEKNIENKVKNSIDKSQKEYFLREKIKAIKEELGETNSKDDEIDSLREKVNKLEAPEKIKKRLNDEINRYETLSSLTPEVNVVRNYIDWLLNLPWNKVSIDNDDLGEARKILDNSHYGLEKVKTRIIEYLVVKKITNSLKSPILCLVGPPGVGKTSLAYSIAKAAGREFTKISVGGIHDDSEIIGHRKSYVGSSPGKIIQGLKKVKVSNPVFLIDEIDKMTKNVTGDPASCLLSVLDPEQNNAFCDNYIEEDVDLSRVMFVATANYIDDIPEALKDRLEIVELSGYTEFEKLDIAKKHLLKKICENHGLNYEKVSIGDSVILNIIRKYTKEAGVRELERQLSTIIRKVVTQIVTNNIKIEKVNILEKDLEKYLGKPKFIDINKLDEAKVGIVNGLAYTYYGGDTLPIEVTYFKGDGKLMLTGSLGDVMKESASLALSYIKANYKIFGLDYEKINKSDIHIHVPEGAIKKDGPSAGIALTTALISAFSNLKVDINLAMTGEMTLRGKILPIGGLKEKSIGAFRNNINTIIIPKENESNLDDIPKEIKEKIKYILVDDYVDVYKIIERKT